MLSIKCLSILSIFAGPALSQSSTSREADAGSSAEEGLEIHRSEDGRTSIRLDARLYLDGAVYGDDEVVIDGNSDLSLSGGTEARQARFGVKGIIDDDWSFEIDLDAADSELDLNDAFIGYATSDATRIRFGQFKEPFSLQRVTSSRYRTFMERPLLDAFAPGRHLGIGVDTGGDRWSLSGGLFGQDANDVNDRKDFENADDEGFGLVGRATFAPVNRPGMTLHLGASARGGIPDSETDKSDETSDIVRYRSRPETHVSRIRFLDTGKIKGVNTAYLYGVEAAAAVGPIHLQSEYVSSHLSRSGDPDADFRDADFDGFYASIAWRITGETRPYRSREGEFGRITPRSELGAWELAFRYSGLDLNDRNAGILGGSSIQRTVGLNWYVTSRTRFMLDYSWAINDANANADGDSLGNEDLTILQFRVQVSL